MSGCRGKLSLIEKYHGVEVSAKDGVVYINVRVSAILKEEIKKELESIVKSVPGVKDVKVHKMSTFQYYGIIYQYN